MCRDNNQWRRITRCQKQWWGPSIEGTLRKNPPPIFLSYCKQKYNNKKYLLILCCFHSKDYPRSRNWTLDFEPAFSQRFDFPLSPRSYFHTGQRFPIQIHITSSCMSPRSLFSNWSAVSHSKTHHFRLDEPTIPFSTWSAVSHPTSGHDVTRPIRSHHLCHTSRHYY